MSEDQIISDPSDLKKYRTEIPNLFDDSDLDVYEFRLLAHYKRVGKCTESLETTSKKCKMSEGKVSEARQSLADKAFIALQRVNMDKGRYRYIVTVLDRWIENFAKYSGLSIEEIAEQVKKSSHSPREGKGSPHEGSPSPREGKKELFKNLKTLSHAEFTEMTVQEARQVLTLKMYAAATDFFPGSVVWEYVNDFIVENKLTEEQIKTAAVAWSLRGYRKENVEGILQWARDGVPPKGVKRANATNKSGNTKRAEQPGQKKTNYSDDDKAAAERVRQRKTANVPGVQ